MPWLIDQVQEQLQKSQLGRLVLDGMIRDVMNQRIEAYNKTAKPAAGGGATTGGAPSDSKPADSSSNAVPSQAPAAATTSEVNIHCTKYSASDILMQQDFRTFLFMLCTHGGKHPVSLIK